MQKYESELFQWYRSNVEIWNLVQSHIPHLSYDLFDILRIFQSPDQPTLNFFPNGYKDKISKKD